LAVLMVATQEERGIARLDQAMSFVRTPARSFTSLTMA
jgi:hypothetical protein